MTRKFDKAKRARSSHDEKIKELTVAIRQLDRVLARNFILKQKIQLTNVTKREFNQFFKLSVRSRDVPLVRALLAIKSKLDTNIVTHLLWEVINDIDTRIAEMLIQAGANVNNKSFVRNTNTSMLHVLAKSNDRKQYELALLLIKHGADIMARDVDDYSVLEEAFLHGNLTLARYLLQNGASIGEDDLWAVIENPCPMKSLMLLVNGDHVKDNTIRSKIVSDTFRSLCSFYIDENKLVDMTNVLFSLVIPEPEVIVQAIRHRRIGVIKSLLQRDDIDKRMKMSFLHCATTDRKSSEMTRILIEWGVDVNYPFDINLSYFGQGVRPLHVACRYDSYYNIQLLLQHGADVNANDGNRGATPFSYIIDDNLGEARRIVIKHFALLTSNGATVNEYDLARIESQSILQEFYEECLHELQAMKQFQLFQRLSFYSVLQDKDIIELVLSTRRQKCLENYNDSIDFFSMYREELNLKFQHAKILKELLTPKENAVVEVLRGILPVVPIEKIIRYLFVNEINALTDDELFFGSLLF